MTVIAVISGSFFCMQGKHGLADVRAGLAGGCGRLSL